METHCRVARGAGLSQEGPPWRPGAQAVCMLFRAEPAVSPREPSTERPGGLDALGVPICPTEHLPARSRQSRRARWPGPGLTRGHQGRGAFSLCLSFSKPCPAFKATPDFPLMVTPSPASPARALSLWIPLSLLPWSGRSGFCFNLPADSNLPVGQDHSCTFGLDSSEPTRGQQIFTGLSCGAVPLRLQGHPAEGH